MRKKILDDGRVKDSQGPTISFTNTVIIKTSNVGPHYILDTKDSSMEKERVYETIICGTSTKEGSRSVAKDYG
uniref:Casein lytic proteinase B34 n=1 Tax=Tanacetum cinerariifolium TaxID=118510 RepID=A0A699HTK0_TANCI|nr:casein lytic proteinase B34 [Tanacetum cinerariifolium]